MWNYWLLAKRVLAYLVLLATKGLRELYAVHLAAIVRELRDHINPNPDGNPDIEPWDLCCERCGHAEIAGCDDNHRVLFARKLQQMACLSSSFSHSSPYLSDGGMPLNLRRTIRGSCNVDAHWIHEFDKIFSMEVDSLEPEEIKLLIDYHGSGKGTKNQMLIMDDIETLAIKRCNTPTRYTAPGIPGPGKLPLAWSSSPCRCLRVWRVSNNSVFQNKPYSNPNLDHPHVYLSVRG
jgi:hypothetical protein